MVVEGRPHSKSRKGKGKIKSVVESFRSRIEAIIPEPQVGPLEVKVEVLTKDRTSLPDADRFIAPIIDAFKGIIYEDDKQIRNVHPRVFETAKLTIILECKTDPMGLYQIESIPIGSLIALCVGIYDDHVVRIKY